MPTAFRAFRSLLEIDLGTDCCHLIAAEIEAAKDPESVFRSENIMNRLCESGAFDEPKAEALTRVIRNCFLSERFNSNFVRNNLKTELVRAGFDAQKADAILDAIEPAVVAPTTAEVRAPIVHTPGAGRVVMCDFRFLQKPEMQKERRAIVISPRRRSGPKRCTVVPVTKKPPYEDDPHCFKFEAGSYPFFSPDDPVWAVCDHPYTVSLARLWQVNVARKPQLPKISDEELTAIRRMVAAAIGHV